MFEKISEIHIRDWAHFVDALRSLQNAGFDVANIPIYWDLGGSTMILGRENGQLIIKVVK